jgi:chaperonin GroES
MKIVPLNDEILVQYEPEEITKSGLYIPHTAGDKPTVVGEVLAVSEGILLENGQVRPHPVKPGDIVLFDKRNATEIEDAPVTSSKKDGPRPSLLLIRSLSLLAKVQK